MDKEKMGYTSATAHEEQPDGSTLVISVSFYGSHGGVVLHHHKDSKCSCIWAGTIKKLVEIIKKGGD